MTPREPFLFTPGPSYPDTFLSRLRRFGNPLDPGYGALDRIASLIRLPLDRAWFVRRGRLRELKRLGESMGPGPLASDAPRVLVLSLRMWTHHVALESVLAQALRLRGADVVMVTCGGGQPICEVGWGRRAAPRPCNTCAYFTARAARSGGLPMLRLADEFPWGASPARAPSALDRTPGLSPSDAPAASVAWMTKSAVPSGDAETAAIARDFDISVAAVESAFDRTLERVRPDVVLAVNGLFAAERTARAVGAARGVRVVTYEMAARRDTLVFGESSAAPEMVTPAFAAGQTPEPLSTAENEVLDAYLEARVSGAGANEQYFAEALNHDPEAVRKVLGVRPGVRVVSAFTNLAWDTAVLGKDIAYESQFDWLVRAVELVDGRHDTILVIRIHPSESRWGTAQPVAGELADRVGELPRNVVLVPPDEPLSSYGLLGISDLVLCYTTTVGLEAAVRGIPVAVAGRTHYRGRGFTVDIESHAELESAIADVRAMSPEQVDLARPAPGLRRRAAPGEGPVPRLHLRTHPPRRRVRPALGARPRRQRSRMRVRCSGLDRIEEPPRAKPVEQV
jgi:hypothetical protein